MEKKIIENKENMKKSPQKDIKILGWSIGGCIGIVIIIGFMVLGGTVGISAEQWLIEHNFINNNYKNNEENCNCKATVDNVDQTRFKNVYEKIRSGVVSIAITDKRYVKEDETDTNIGTGFIVDSSGIILTNNHVVSETSWEYVVVTEDGRRYTPTKIVKDVVNDVAIIKIDPGDTELKVLEIGNSDNLMVGDEVIAIGSALGELTQTVTTGVVSGLGRSLPYDYGDDYGEFENVIQTDAAINPGNSGGPLLNLSGQVIGINFSKYVGYGFDNIGFAIPINTIKNRIDEFKRLGRFDMPYLGVKYYTITYYDAYNNDDLVEGALVKAIIKDSPADKAKIKVDDIITEVNDTRVYSNLDYLIQKHKVGDTIKLKLYRNGSYMTVDVTLQSMPE